jgi:hypothetical protein
MTEKRDPHAVHSVLREKIVERVFTGDLLRHLWRLGRYDVEVLYSDFDAYGYDIVVSVGKTLRHVQLKAGLRASPVRVALSTRLAEKPSACAIWIAVDRTLAIQGYWWFGNQPGLPIPSMEGFPFANRATPNKDGLRPVRSAHKIVPDKDWVRIDRLEDIAARLFGEDVASPPCG